MSGEKEPIVVTLHDGKGYVWDANDWLILRRDYRIVGQLIGCLAHIPRQDSILGMPEVLLPEELTLLLEKKIAVLMKIDNPCEPLSVAIKEKYLQHTEKVNTEQVEVYERKRKAEVKSLIDRIIEGKKRKMAKGELTVPIDEESIYQAEMARVKKVEGMFVQVPTVNPWLPDSQLIPAEWSHPVTSLDVLKYRVFKDLWEKGLYLTNGSKFGGHFLAYPGEPLKFHAFYVVLVVPLNKNISPLSVIQHARLGTHTKKTFVLASVDSDDQLTYHSFEWTGKT